MLNKLTVLLALSVISIFTMFCGQSAYANSPPVITYPSPQYAATNSTVNFSGIATDPDSDPLTYSWNQISGVPVLLLNANSAHPQFLTPSFNTTLTFLLTVSDGVNPSVSATITIHVLQPALYDISNQVTCQAIPGANWTNPNQCDLPALTLHSFDSLTIETGILGQFNVGQNFTNSGNMTVRGGANLFIQSGNNVNTGLISNAGNVAGAGSISSLPSLITNAGTFGVEVEIPTTVFSSNYVLPFPLGVQPGSSITINPGVILTIPGGSHLTVNSSPNTNLGTISNAGTVSGAGTINSPLTSITNTGTFSIPVIIPTTTVSSSYSIHIPVSIQSGVTLAVNSGVLLVTNNLLNIESGGMLVNSGTIDNAGGSVINNFGTFSNAGSGTIFNTGYIYNNPGQSALNVILLNSGYVANFGTLDNSDTINNTGIITNYLTINNNPGHTINNNFGGLINNTSAGNIFTSGNINNNFNSSLLNSGIITKNSGIINNINFILNYVSGIIHNNSGPINNYGNIFNSGTITNSQIITNYCGGTISGGGTLSGNPVNNACSTLILSILSPSAGSTTSLPTVLVSGTTSTNATISSVTYKVDSGSVSTATTSDSFAHWSFTTPLLSNGAHTIFVNATDSSSNTVTNSTTVTVSTTGVGAVATSLLPVAFTSDSFYIESSGGVSIYDPTIAGTGTLSVTVNSATGYSVPITLVESTTTPGLFTSPYSILFTAGSTNTLDPTTLQLNVSPGTNAVSLSYTSPTTSVTNTVYANILVQPTSITVGTAIQFAPSYDTTCSTQGGDTDGDGICDNWEKQGLIIGGKKLVGLWINTGNGYVYKYPQSGACPPAIDDSSGNPPQNPADPTTMPTCPAYNKKDIYVEIDYMSGHKPNRGALAQVVNTFAAHNIQLHIQLDEDLGFHANKIPLDSSILTPTDPNAIINGQSVGFRQLKDAHFGTIKERATAGSNLLNMENDKRQIFHYAMFIHDLQDTPGSSGYAEILGNDFIVSLGDFTNEIGNPDEQAGTFMHELGHNLGLRHGGFEDGPNCKPNYLSVMNYAFQFQNLISGRPLDYSESTLPQLDEVNGLSESAGIGQSTPSGLVSVYGPVTGTVPFDKPLVTSPLSSTSNPVNWNRDSPDVVDSNVQLPVHEIGIPDCQDSTLRVLNGNNDWNSINLVMRTSSTFSDGIYTNPQSPAITEIKATTLNTMDSITGYVPPPATPAQISIGPIVVPTNVTAVNSAITTSVKFIDVDHSSHTASWNWGDGVTTAGVVSQESSNAHPDGQVTGSHSYAKAGIYTITATVQDSTGASTGTSSYQFVIVYDPKAGSLKGEGKYSSPLGALASDPTVAGSARFEFNSHYDKKSTTPNGDFNFELKTGKDFDNDKNTDKLHFKSQSYQWLVVSGNKAEVQGTGTVDGKGTYGFTITVIDVNHKNPGQDLIRIKIWDSSNNVIYDTQPGDPLNADPVIPLKSDHMSIYKDGESDHDRDQRRR